MLNTKLSNSTKPCYDCINIDYIMLYTVNLTCPDALDLRMLGLKAINLVFANRALRRGCL